MISHVENATLWCRFFNLGLELWVYHCNRTEHDLEFRFSARVSSGTATLHGITGLPGSTTFYAVDFASDNYGVLAGGSGGNSVTCHSTNMGTSYTYNTTVVTGTVFHAVEAFYRGSQFSYLAGGTNTILKYWNGSSFVTTACTLPGAGMPSGVTFTDFFFHDDINGYLVGDKGVLLKTDNFAYSTGTGLFTAGDWNLKRTDDNWLGQTDSTQIGNTTIAFATRYEGFVGGDYTTFLPSVQVSYARNIKDESDIFSTYFWYDKLGRIVLSQNSRQYAENTQRFSYTTYDVLGRVSEAGEKYENDAADLQMGSIFGSYVSVHFNPKVIDDDTLANWLAETSGLRTQVTKTYYDTINPDIATHLPATFDQTNLRKRVVHVTYSDTLNVEDSVYNHASHYTYDIHGNVNTLVQDNPQRYSPGGAIASQRYKRLDYEYDLISGNVNEVAYEKDSADMMLHRYEYDADNRIQTVETSIDNVVWDQDAKYIYYAHGPLARVELAENSVQGLDYAYTLQGWIKGVNSNTLDTTRDMGTDADTLSGNANALFGKDVFGYTLNYFDGDYAPIDTSKWTTVTRRFESDKTGSDLLNAREDFYNGNISAMVTTITDTNGTALPQGLAYTYDQLNRIMNAKAWVNIDSDSNKWDNGFTYDDRYYNAFTYDANGNILTQDRYDQSGNQIEDLTYQYAKNGAGDVIQNRLYHVNETINPAAYADDIDDQGAFSSTLSTINTANNYEYDGEGRLVRDSIEEIDTIKWTVTGKVKEVLRTSGSSKKNLKFDYDAMGQRIAKHVYDATGGWEKSTYYVRDPQGNVMTVYDQEVVAASMSYQLKERDIYGSSRVGMYTDTVEMIGATFDTTYMAHVMGMKTFELSNHLGNVLSTISDKVVPKDWDADMVIDNYHAEIMSATDYYAFGVTMHGRDFSSSDYRYSFNTQEREPEISEGIYTAEFWEYDSRSGRRWNTDPMPNESCSPYSVEFCNPIWYKDIKGDTPTVREAAVMAQHVYGADDKGYTIPLEGGWEVAPSSDLPTDFKLEDKASSFKSQVYRRKLEDGSFEYNYTFAGSVEGPDWVNNGDQLGGGSAQYDIAINNAKKLSMRLGSKELTFTGHSLGGGLATAAALATKKNAITFNPAWVSMATVNKYGLNTGDAFRVQNYVVAGELLNMGQNGLAPSPLLHLGHDHTLISPAVLSNLGSPIPLLAIGQAHKMGAVLNAVEFNPQYNKVKHINGKQRGTLQGAGNF